MDIIEKLGQTIIQHGPHNDRIYVMKIHPEDMPHLPMTLEKLAKEKEYSKIFAKVPRWAKEVFEQQGFKKEARIPKMKKGKTDVYFMSKFYKDWRREIASQEIKNVLETALSKQELIFSQRILPEGYTSRLLIREDAEQMAKVYKEVFETYPFPIHDPKYLTQTMADNFIYFGVFEGEKLVALSSSEMDLEGMNVEMTDFSTLPKYRGNGFALYLLHQMEEEMKKRQVKTAFTIARAVSYGMNITFAKKGYTYSGTLINNTNIAGQFETMNVWYKAL